MTKKELAQYIDHTNLHEETTRKQINQMIEEAKKYGFYSLCIAPCWTNYAQNKLKGTDIKVGTVPNWKLGGGLHHRVGFAEHLLNTCDYIDYIWDIYKFCDLKDWDSIKKELDLIRKYTKGELKIIIEAYYIHIRGDFVNPFKKACQMVKDCGAEYIKTDSGLFKRKEFDTLIEDAKLMKKYSKGLKLKVAGGIRTAEQCLKLIKLGADRIGTSAGVKIIEELK